MKCADKQRYLSKKHAVKVRNTMMALPISRRPVKLYIYKCVCGFWHLSSHKRAPVVELMRR